MIYPRRSLVVLLAVLPWTSEVSAFEGRIYATITQGSETRSFLYTVGTNLVRIERTETNWPHAKNIINPNSGVVTLLFPHNRSFVRLKPASKNVTSPFAGAPALLLPPGGSPPGIGPQTAIPSTPASLDQPNLPGVPVPPQMMQRPTMPNSPGPPADLPPGFGPPAGGFPTAAGMPAMSMLPFPPMENADLKATGETTNILGYACARYELKELSETLEIWATDKLLPFQPWRQDQSPHFGPRMIEEQWAELVTARNLFPLRASLHFAEGAEHYRFEVQSITSQKLTEEDRKLFLPPDGYFEIQPLPF